MVASVAPSLFRSVCPLFLSSPLISLAFIKLRLGVNNLTRKIKYTATYELYIYCAHLPPVDFLFCFYC